MEGASHQAMRGRRAAMLGRECAALAALCAFAASPVAAQTTTSAESQAVIQEPMSVYAVQDMDFGQILTDGTPGTVTIDANTQICVATAPLVRTGPCRTAIFSGYAGFFSTIRIDSGPQLTLTGPGGATMIVDNIQYVGAGGFVLPLGNGQFLVIDGDGLYQISVGGRLNVGVNQPPGEYTGTITAELNYN